MFACQIALNMALYLCSTRVIIYLIYISSFLVTVIKAYCSAGYKQACTSGYTSYSGSGYDYCYKGVRTDLTWTDAKSSCSSDSAWLVTIHSADENTLINSFLSCRKWIGYNDIASESNFVWLYGSSSYTNWASGQPDDGGNDEDCAEQYASGTWNDKECYHTLPCYVCQQTPTCSMCPANTYSAAGDSTCTDCPSGKFSGEGSSSCMFYPSTLPTYMPSWKPTALPSRNPTALPTAIPRYLFILLYNSLIHVLLLFRRIVP